MEAESNTVGNTNCSSSDSKKDSNPCLICLRSIHEDAYLDCCFHKFCYDCIAHWAKLVASKHRNNLKASLLCPFCKGENFSIIHGCDGHSYQQHFISQDLEKGASVDFLNHATTFLFQKRTDTDCSAIIAYQVPYMKNSTFYNIGNSGDIFSRTNGFKIG